MKEQFNKLMSKTIWSAIILFCLRCFISWNDIKNAFSVYDLFGYAGEAISLATLLSITYERWLWKFNPLESTPVLSKKYTGSLISSYDNIERNAELEIKQTLLTIQIILITGESKSKSLSSTIDDILGETILTYCYLNTPNANVRDRSEIHYGTAMLCVDNPRKLTGQYFTDRKTIGDMKFNSTP